MNILLKTMCLPKRCNLLDSAAMTCKMLWLSYLHRWFGQVGCKRNKGRCEQTTQEGCCGADLTYFAVQRDMEHLVTCSYDGSVAVWEVRSGQGFQPTQLSRWNAHGPAATALLPSALTRSTAVQHPEQRTPETAAQGLERINLQTKGMSSVVEMLLARRSHVATGCLWHDQGYSMAQASTPGTKYSLG